jgi:mRNA-degrading endonuclease toxin of MazEF toxin-antitoxin module
MAIRGADPLHIRHRAGHTSFATTQGYIRQAEAVRTGFGEVFPGLDGPEDSVALAFQMRAIPKTAFLSRLRPLTESELSELELATDEALGRVEP